MSEFGLVQTSLAIPTDLKVSIENKVVTISGSNGTLKRDFSFARTISLEKRDNDIIISTIHPRKKEKSLLNTLKSHIANLMKGAQNNYIYKMKIVFAHFPLNVSISKEGDKVLIDNFLGERSKRVAKIEGEKTKVTVEGDDVIIQSPYIEDVGQTAANIRHATRIKRKDPRVFQDGIYVFQKAYGDEEFWKLKV